MEYIRVSYQLRKDEEIQTDILGYHIDESFWRLTPDGILIAKRGYAWDGATGAIDTSTNRRASLFHDVICQIIGRGGIPLHYIDEGNELYYIICRSDGMIEIRAWIELKAIQYHFMNGTMPEGYRKVYNT